jgi:hypothetical protein
MSATLGCPGEYNAVIFFRGGGRPTFTLRGVTALSWTRKLDGVSTASVSVVKMSSSADCCAEIGTTQPWSHELALYRDNDLVWQGPVQIITEDNNVVTIQAADVVAWMSVRINHIAFDFNNSGVDQTDMAMFYISQAFAQDDPNVLDHIVALPTGRIMNGSATNAYTTTWFNALDTLAKQDLDYTTVGRRILLGGDLSVLMPRLALSDRSFLTNLQLIQDGTQLATRFCANGSEGANNQCVGGVDTFYGLVERMVTAESINSDAEAIYNARSELDVSYPQPLVIQVPSGASLTDSAPVTMESLICGARIDVSLTSFCREIAQPMRLTSLDVSWNGQLETVAVTLDPFRGSSRTAVQGS